MSDESKVKEPAAVASAAPGSAYPHLTAMSADDLTTASRRVIQHFASAHLTAMSADDLATLLRCVSRYPEDADFAKAVAEEIKSRKPSPGATVDGAETL